jgi:hypothetical protein
VTARFEIEQNSRGERAVRTTTGAPKKLTYADKMRIVDGDDGNIYIAEYHGGFVKIKLGDMKHQEEVVYAYADKSRFAALRALFA